MKTKPIILIFIVILSGILVTQIYKKRTITEYITDNYSIARAAIKGGATARSFLKSSYERECNKNDALACERLAILYLKGSGVSKDKFKAFNLYKRSCHLGDGWSCGMVARSLKTGEGTDKDIILATDYYVKGCDLNDGVACDNAGLQYLQAIGVPKNLSLAETYFKKGILLKDTFSASNLAAVYAEQGHLKESIQLAKQECDKGLSVTCHNLAYSYKQSKKYPLAYSYYIKSCNLNFGQACVQATKLIFDKKEGVSYNEEKMLALSKKACKLKEAVGCSWLGYLYSKGIGTSVDKNKSLKFYKKSCDLGYLKNCTKQTYD